MAYGLGLDSIDDERSIIPVDIDQDGDLDILASSLQRLKLFENHSPPKSFVRVTLEATKTQHYALGAQVVLTAGGVVQRDYVKLTAGFQSQVPLELHFGLGEVKVVDKLEVFWPSGEKSSFNQLKPNQRYKITEGQSKPLELAVRAWSKSTQKSSLKRMAMDASAPTLSGASAPMAQVGRPAVLNFWAPWCKPCAQELPELRALSSKLTDKVQFAGISVEREKTELVKQSIKKYKLSYPQFYANDEIVESFFGSDGEIPLPSTFVFSASGNLVRVFSRAIKAEELEATLEELSTEKLNPEFIRPIVESYLIQGRQGEALRLLEGAVKNHPDNVKFLIQLGNIRLMMNRAKEALIPLQDAVQKAPEAHYAWYLLGIGNKKLGRNEASLEALRKASALDKKKLEYAMSLGAAQSGMNDLQSAVKTFERATKIAPTNVLAWINLGKAHAMLKQTEEAGRAFRRALVIEPNNQIARGLLQRYGK